MRMRNNTVCRGLRGGNDAGQPEPGGDGTRPCSAFSAPAMPISAPITDVSKAVGECGIITSLINKFNADNPDVHVKRRPPSNGRAMTS